MKKDIVYLSLRLSPELMEKLAHIADFEMRSRNREIEQLIKKRIHEFEREHGIIELSETVLIP